MVLSRSAPLAQRCPPFERLLVTFIDAWAVGYLPPFASLKQMQTASHTLALAQLLDLSGSHTGRGVLNVVYRLACAAGKTGAA